MNGLRTVLLYSYSYANTTIFFIFVHPISGMAGYGQDTFYIVDVCLACIAFSSLRPLLLFTESAHSVMIIMYSTRGCLIAVGS
jgi:hypothetical protein